MAEAGALIYFDTNVYSRPFDNQSQPVIQQESNAFLEIIAQVRNGTFRLLNSDILEFEVANILKEDKRSKVRSYLELCSEHVASGEDVLSLGTRIQSSCHVRPRDALHVASAIIGGARFFLSCDNKVTQMKQARCYRTIGRSFRVEYFSAMNPVRFSEKLQKGVGE